MAKESSWLADVDSMRRFIATLKKESDRGCTLLAAALLDTVLQRLIEAATISGKSQSLFAANGPLDTFSAKIDVARAMGLVSEDECRDLHLIRKIRNEFAHELDAELSCESQAVRSRIEELRAVRCFMSLQGLADKKISPEEKKVLRENARRRFEVEVGILFSQLESRSRTVTAPKNVVGLIELDAQLRNQVETLKRRIHEDPQSASQLEGMLKEISELQDLLSSDDRTSPE